MNEALRLADALEVFVRDACLEPHGNTAKTAAELRRLHSELERKSDAIQRLWKERDELRSENRTLVRQNGEWQELNAELVEALRWCIRQMPEPVLPGDYTDGYKKARAALAKVEASNG